MSHVYRRINLNTKVTSFFHYTNMEEYNLKYHDDVYTDPVGRGVLPYKRLRGCAAGWGRIFMTGWTIMGLHFQ